MSTLNLKNQTNNDIIYSLINLTVPANSNANVPVANQTIACGMQELRNDVYAENIYVGDGQSTYKREDAMAYLDFIGMRGAVVLGAILDGGNDLGAPIKIGGVYRSTIPIYTNGNRADIQVNFHGAQTFQFRTKFSNLAGNATTTVKSGMGVLHGISINNNTTGGTATVYDNTAASGTKIMTLTFGTPSGGLLSSSGQHGPVPLGPLGAEFATGLTIVTAGSTSNDITVYYV